MDSVRGAGLPARCETRSHGPRRRHSQQSRLLVLLGLAEELAGAQSERASDSLQVCQGEILLTALDSADVRAVHSRTIREDFLRQSRGTPESLHDGAKSDLQWPHARTVCAWKSRLHTR